jgi:hypothetical protein
MAAKKMKKSSTAPAPPPPPSLEEQRKKFVADKVAQGVSREAAKQQFYVQTRARELASQGKEVTPAVRAQLRQNWQTGKVKREGFGAPKKPLTTTTTTKTTEPKVTTKTETPTKKVTTTTKRTGPETTSYTSKKPSRTGPETMAGRMSPASKPAPVRPRVAQVMADRPPARAKVQAVPDRLMSLYDRTLASLEKKHGVGDSRFFWSPDNRVTVFGNSNILGKHGAKVFVERDLKNMGYTQANPYNRKKRK